MKIINREKRQIDPMAKARRFPKFRQYSADVRAKILLATEIYKARTEKGLSQQELAKNAQTTQKVVSKIENGQVNVGLDLIFRIVRALGLKLQVGRTFLL